MAITRLNPNTVLLSGPKLIVNDLVASEAITPGHLIEMHSDSGTLKWRKHATSTEIVTLAVALEQSAMNKTVSDDYAATDLVEAAFLQPGSTFWGLIPSGNTIAVGDFLQSNGGGTLKTPTATTADAALAKFQSLDALGVVTVLTRCRVQVIQ